MQCGVVYVTATGITRMHLWSADNLDTQPQVRIMGGPCTVSSVSVCWRVPVVSGPCQYETRLNEPLNVQASYYSAACLSKTLKV